MFFSGLRSSLPFQFLPKGIPIDTLQFLIRRADTEPSKLNRIWLLSDKEGSEETSQVLKLSRTAKPQGCLPYLSRR